VWEVGGGRAVPQCPVMGMVKVLQRVMPNCASVDTLAIKFARRREGIRVHARKRAMLIAQRRARVPICRAHRSPCAAAFSKR